MALITILEGEKILFKGEYEYIEGGRNELGNPSFHIDISTREKDYKHRQLYFSFGSEEEFNKFVKDLMDQIKKK